MAWGEMIYNAVIKIDQMLVTWQHQKSQLVECYLKGFGTNKQRSELSTIQLDRRYCRFATVYTFQASEKTGIYLYHES